MSKPGDSVIVPFVDSFGSTHYVEMTSAVAEVIAQAEPRLKERLFRRPEGVDQLPDRTASAGEWPRLRFELLLGESPTWPGPVGLWGSAWRDGGLIWTCLVCRGRRLAGMTYCLNCDHCSRELDIPGPGVIAMVRQDHPNDNLKGGLEGKK